MNLNLTICTLSFLASLVFFNRAQAATEFISVIDPDNGSGTDYTSLSAWEAANQSSLTSATTLVIAGSLTRGTITDGTAIIQTTTGATAFCVHHTSTQMLISALSGTPNATDTWYPIVNGNDATNAWTPTDAGDNVIAVAKCRSTAGTADTTAVTIDGWTTSATNYIKIWTDPGENYRHQGVWDEGKYRLSITSGNAMTILENYIRIEGLQVYNSDLTYGDGIRFDGGGELWIYQSILQGNPSATDGCRGVYLDSMYDGTVKIYNNVMYGWNSNDIYYQYLANVSSSATLYIYNNTFYGGNEHGLNLVDGTKDVVFLKNNISYDSGSNDYNLSNSSITSSNNLSSDATSPDAAYQNQIVHFTDEVNDDFHLDSADTGARNQGTILYDSGDDANLNFTTDVDNNTRLDSAGTWDIGADEAITKVYRSVGPSATTAIATGATYGNVEIKPAYVSGSTTNIADYVATFWSDLPTNVGVGDALQYDDDDDGDIDASDSIVFITKRIDAAHFSVRTASGSAPASTLAPDSDWSIFRAYTSLSNAESASANADENDSIDDDLENFDNWSSGRDIATNQEQWNMVCYAGQGGVADTVAVVINGWTTSVDSYIKIYTPTRNDEVGASQRHSGVWNDTNYALVVNSNIALYVYENFVRIDGLQIKTTNPTASSQNCIVFTSLTTGGKIYVSNNIFKGHASSSYYQRGIHYYSTSQIVNFYIYNNILYDFVNNSSSQAFYMGGTVSNFYVYNNTAIDCYGGFLGLTGANMYLFNNIAQGCSNGFDGDTNPLSDFNISNNSQSDADQANVTFNGYKTVSFLDTANDDFHLAPSDTSAKNAGADLSNDSYIPSNTDIDSSCLRKDNQSRVTGGGDDQCYTRPKGTSWDIGADELITKIYRSVAPDADGTLEALTTGATNAMTIASSTATFATALAVNIGVGDAIQYDDDGDSDIDASDSIVFISGRTDSTHFTVKTASGAIPTAVSADTDWSLFRAYTSLYNAETGTENLAIDADLRNFDSWSGGRDIASNSEQWNIACYANGTTADTVAVNMDGWTTAPQNYIKIYTPYLTTEVGTSQRHYGKWDTNKYILQLTSTANNQHIIDVRDDYWRIEGVQLQKIGGAFTGGVNIYVYPGYISPASGIYISNNILKGDNTQGQGVLFSDSDANGYISNNMIYGVTSSASGDGISVNGMKAKIYNNTVYGCYRGIYTGGNASNLVLKNNISFNNVDYDYGSGTYFSGTTNNLSEDATAPAYGTYYRSITDLAFVDATNADFHLAATDIRARNLGIDLSQDYNLPITNDIDGNARTLNFQYPNSNYDIGADESATPIYRSIAPSMSTYLDRGVDESGTDLSISGTTLTLENAAPDNVGVGDAIQYDSDGNSSIDAIAFISSRASSTSFTVQARDGSQPVAVTNDQDWQIFRAYTTLDNAEGGAENTANIDDDVDDFDISVSRNDGKDIYASNEQWNIAAYANGTTADTVAVVVDNWTTYPTNYIKIYTPVSTSEVGTSQRHEGKWDEGKYRLEKMEDNGSILIFAEDYITIDGLQIYNSGTSFARGINHTGAGEFQLSNSILKGGSGTGIYINSKTGAVLKMWNNIFYDWGSSAIFYAYGNVQSMYLNNNTFIDCAPGNPVVYIEGNNATVSAKNNLVQGTASSYNYRLLTSSLTTSNNLSEDSSSPDVAYRNQNVIFVDEINHDFHLASSDTSARDAGVNLWSDANIAIKSDIDGDPRSEQGGWDIGADEGIFYQSNVAGHGTATMQMSLTDKMTDGLVGMWSFDGPDIDWTTNTAYDRSPAGGNDGTITGATPAIGKKGQALNFNGSGNYVNIGSTGILGGVTDFSIAAWVRLGVVTQDQAIYWKAEDSFSQNGDYALFFDDVEINSGNTDVFNFLFYDGGVYYRAYTTTGFATTGEWYYVVGIAESGQSLKIYVNGVDETDDASPVWNGTLDAVLRDEAIGNASDGSGRDMSGIIDEVRVYNRALSSDEILRLYNLGNVEYVR
jgi:hypothetical protein